MDTVQIAQKGKKQMIEVKNLTKYYGNHKAVDHISFSIKEGTVCGFLGPNGAGKSTTMNIMTGCLSATSGNVSIGEYDILEQPIEAKKMIGYLLEQPPLYLEETPREYLRFVAQAKKIPRESIREEIENVMKETQIIRGVVMEILSIMNGAADLEIQEMIKKFALLKGFLTWTPESGPGKKGISHRTVLAVTDQKGVELYGGILQSLCRENCPVILLLSREKEIRQLDKNSEYTSVFISRAFSFQEFQRILHRYVQEDAMKDRRRCFGKMQMEEKQHLLIRKGREVRIGPYEFEVLFYMLEHIGAVVSREEINEALPSRKRDGGRNVDTHIKNLRRRLDMHDVILSVRSVGYRIDEEKFYRKVTGKDF